MKVNEILLQAGVNPDTADFSDIWAAIEKPDPFVSKKDEVGTDLTMLLAHANISRTALADKSGWKKSRISRLLSGIENLTLRTIFELCQITGYEFDITFRKKTQAKPLQPWQRIEIVQNYSNNNVFNIKSTPVSTSKKLVSSIAICGANDDSWRQNNYSGLIAR